MARVYGCVWWEMNPTVSPNRITRWVGVTVVASGGARKNPQEGVKNPRIVEFTWDIPFLASSKLYSSSVGLSEFIKIMIKLFVFEDGLFKCT